MIISLSHQRYVTKEAMVLFHSLNKLAFRACIILALFPHSVTADTLELSTLEWPPFTGVNLIDNGVTSQIVQQALSYEGHDLKVTVLPWNRAIRVAKKGGNSGYFPEYINATNDFIFSNSLGNSPIGLLERKNNPIKWDIVSDLNKYTLGVVKGYVNTEEIDKMIVNGQQPFEAASDERQNILNLAAGRIDAIVIDYNVYQYLQHEPKIADIADLLQMNTKPLELKSLHIAFSKTRKGREWLDIINRGLSQFDAQQMMDAYLIESSKHQNH